MVCLNYKLQINLRQMKTELIKEIDSIIDHELYYIDDKKLDENRKNKLKNNIIRKIKKTIDTDNFIYRIMDDEHCTYKYIRGKKEAMYCGKKINTNLIDNKKDYLCCSHSKKHIPKKRDKKDTPKTKLINISNNTIPTKQSIELIDKNKDKSLGENKNNIISIEKSINLINNNYIENNIKKQKKQKINYICQKNNIYKNYILNDEYLYKTLTKEFSLLDFVINKFKKNKNNYNKFNFINLL